MSSEKNQKEKIRLHTRNKNRERYDLSALTKATPELKNQITLNKYGVESVDFSNPLAVKLLNTAILSHYYGIANWEFPDKNLCPPIPGRADYIHHMADLLAENNFGTIPTGDKITGLDIGLGASCIYPIIGVTEYGWKFIGSDIDPKSIASSQQIVNSNSSIKGKIECRLQKNSKDVFYGILNKEDRIEFTVCNPPFHSSAEDAQKGSQRKIMNLSGKKVKTPELNFSGISKELIYDGGEYKFIQNMIRESEKFSKNCLWFSTLVSKQSNLKRIYALLENTKAIQIKTIPMGTGNKSSRIVTWTFLSKEERKEWRETRWQTII
ncbi:MAG: 23S rRNA (adenine(1618)-N(6))-methyltransferase RlmF [Cyclobacteriaceae bacterium]